MQQLPELPQPPQPPQPAQLAGPARIVQVPKTAGPSGDIATMELIQLRAHADALKLRVSDLEMQVGQIAEARSNLGPNVSPEERQQFAKPMADATHELASARIQLEATQKQISELETARDARTVISVPPPMPPETVFGREHVEMAGIGLFALLIPIVLAYTRRIWQRGGREQPVNLAESDRLQRMEQAIESIALEVERIGEGQRFTTKLLADRQPEAAARLGVIPRREPGTITPH